MRKSPMQDVIEWLEGEISRLEQSPGKHAIAENIAGLRDELKRLKARYPGNPSAEPEDAGKTS